MLRGYLLDTNHFGQAVTLGSAVRDRVVKVRVAGAKIGTCVPVLCEIEVGIRQIARPDLYRLGMDRLLREVRIWPIDKVTAQLYGEIHSDLKRRGRVLSQVDIMLASLCRQMKLTLVTTDKDFEALPDIRTESWIA